MDDEYVLHYTSADGPGPEATWSVYREVYANFGDDAPIDGATEWVSKWPSEALADREASRLQSGPPDSRSREDVEKWLST